VVPLFSLALEGLSDEFRPVVRADERRRRIDADQLFQHGHDVLGLASPADPDGQAEPAVLSDHVEELEPPAIGVGVELEVQLLRRSPRAMPKPGAGA